MPFARHARWPSSRMKCFSISHLMENVRRASRQIARPRLLEQRHSFQRQVVERVRRNLAELDRQLAEQKAVSRLKVEGGWCAVLRVPATRSDEGVAIELLTAYGVSVHPGHFYDFPSDGFLVVSLIAPSADYSQGMASALTVPR